MDITDGPVAIDHGTSHITAVDKDRNAVAFTSTVGDNFGSWFISNSTGIILNSLMNSFTRVNGTSDNLPIINNNIIKPGKFPMASIQELKQSYSQDMCPTIVLKDNKLVMALGGAGGAKIPAAVAQVLLCTKFTM